MFCTLLTVFCCWLVTKDGHVLATCPIHLTRDCAAQVEFRVIVFKPVNDEWIVGSIASCDKSGINVSLGFFRDIVIPASNMRLPYAYDNQREVWVWKYRNAETRENINFFYEANELIRFRVMSTRFCDGSRSTGKESVMQVGPKRAIFHVTQGLAHHPLRQIPNQLIKTNIGTHTSGGILWVF